jgi:hypothetical protein
MLGFVLLLQHKISFFHTVAELHKHGYRISNTPKGKSPTLAETLLTLYSDLSKPNARPEMLPESEAQRRL